MAGGGGVPEWAAARDGGGSMVDWDGWMGAQRREAATHERGMGEMSFRGDLVLLGERREWSEASGLLDVLLMVALSFTITSKYTPCVVARNSAGCVVILTTCATQRIV
jgi:hypothetical protein